VSDGGKILRCANYQLGMLFSEKTINVIQRWGSSKCGSVYVDIERKSNWGGWIIFLLLNIRF
jgi:hypothetical protein